MTFSRACNGFMIYFFIIMFFILLSLFIIRGGGIMTCSRATNGSMNPVRNQASLALDKKRKGAKVLKHQHPWFAFFVKTLWSRPVRMF
jgi:hypothetical protein